MKSLSHSTISFVIEDLLTEIDHLTFWKDDAFIRLERTATEASECREEREAALGRAELLEKLLNERKSPDYTTLQKRLEVAVLALKKLSKGWLYWPANTQPDPRVMMYQSRTLDEIEKMATDTINFIETLGT